MHSVVIWSNLALERSKQQNSRNQWLSARMSKVTRRVPSRYRAVELQKKTKITQNILESNQVPSLCDRCAPQPKISAYNSDVAKCTLNKKITKLKISKTIINCSFQSNKTWIKQNIQTLTIFNEYYLIRITIITNYY